MIEIKEKIKNKPIEKIGNTSCKECTIGQYIQANFKSHTGQKAQCKMCEDRNLNATQLPLIELWKRLNQDYTELEVQKFYPSINNFCPKCGELYDDGKAYRCPKCKSETFKKFTKKIEFVPNYIFKHKLNELFLEFKRVSFSHKYKWLV